MLPHGGFSAAAVLGALVVIAGCGQQQPQLAPGPEGREGRGRGQQARQRAEQGAPAEGEQDILETAQAAGQFTSLLAAVRSAGLVDTLKGEGPFTVFAPTNGAFDKLPEGTLDDLLNRPENREQLTSMLTYHVVPGKYKAADVLTMESAQTANGRELRITVEDRRIMVDGAMVTQRDIEASNGVIHVVDAVLMPW